MRCWIAGIVVLGVAVGRADAPPKGWTTSVDLVRVVDGDTVDVRVSRVLRIRLIDVWAPERRAPGGPEATAHLQQLLSSGDLTLHIPGSTETRDILTFGRFTGHVWAGDLHVGKAMVAAGHATAEKGQRSAAQASD